MHRVHGRTDDSANASQPPEHSGAVGRSGSAHPGLGRAWAWSWRECSSHGHRARGYKENEKTPHHTPREVRKAVVRRIRPGTRTGWLTALTAGASMWSRTNWSCASIASRQLSAVSSQ